MTSLPGSSPETLVTARKANRRAQRNPSNRTAQRRKIRPHILLEAIESRLLLSTINVLGNGVQITSGSTAVSASNLTDFGASDIAHRAVTETFTITDPDLAQSLNLTGPTPVALTGINSADFSVLAQPGSNTLAANGGSTTFTISFSAKALGGRRAVVSIASDDSASPFTFAIFGRGAPAIELGGVASGAQIVIPKDNTPSAATFTDFAYTATNAPAYALTRTFVIENSGGSTVNLTGSPAITISGASSDFTVTTQPAVVSLDGTNQTWFTITFAPLTGHTGTLNATVTIANTGSTNPFTFNIRGTALAATVAQAGLSTLLSQIAPGTGASSLSGESIVVNYTGRLLDGTIFDSSLNPGRNPFTFLLGADPANGNQFDVIVGWEVGMLNLKPGESRLLLIPAAEAYGAGGSGSVPPGANLIFVVQRLPQVEIVDDVSKTYIYNNSTPLVANHTDFGLVAPGTTPFTRTFDISVPGQLPNIKAPTAAGFTFNLTGAGASQFRVSVLQSASDGHAFFTVSYLPGTVSGLKQAIVNFPYILTNSLNVSTSNVFSFMVQGGVKVTPAAVVTTSAPAPAYGQTITLTATVTGTPGTAPSGALNFFNGTTLLGAATLGTVDAVHGRTTWTLTTAALSAGSHAITAAYAGDGTYTASNSAAFTQTINKLALSVTGITANNKIYTGGPLATLNTAGAVLAGLLPADIGHVALITTGATGTFANTNVGNGITVTVNGLALSGTAAGNYSVTAPATTANITPRPLTVSGIVVNNKIYDGTNVATFSATAATLVNLISIDTGKVVLLATGAVATFSGINPATGLVVSISGLTIGGVAASNYTLLQPTTTTANIVRRALTVTGITAADKFFDGTTTATLNTTSATVSGVLNVDLGKVALNPSAAFGTFSSAAVGNNKTITITRLALFGPEIANYSIAPATTTASILANALPIGSVAPIVGPVVKGWTIDTDTLNTALTVRVDVDGVMAGTTTANITRADLQSVYGTQDHGFSFTLPPLMLGPHRVDVYAIDSATSTAKLLASREFTTNQTPIGAVGAFNGSLLKGWAFDPDAGAASIQIRYTIDGGAPVLATASVTRSDLLSLLGSTDHGFAITLPQLTAGLHSVSVWAIDQTTDEIMLLGTVAATVTSPAGNPLPTGSIAPATTTLVKGWAYDPSSPTAAVSVRIDVDGVPGVPFAANGNRTDLVPVIGSANHGISQALSLTPGAHRIDVYALDSTSATPVLLSRQFVGNPAPLGSVSPTVTSTVRGWAFAAGLAGAPATVRLDIDGVVGLPTLANASRPDLTPLLGGPNFGYVLSLLALPAGAHTGKVWVIDLNTLTPTLIGTISFVTT